MGLRKCIGLRLVTIILSLILGSLEYVKADFEYPRNVETPRNLKRRSKVDCTIFNATTAAQDGPCFDRKKNQFVKPNFVLIYVDDLRYMLDSDPCFETVMPNLRKIIKKGIHFENTACPKPICTPSRVSFLTGRRVGQLKARDFQTNFNEDYETFPGILHKHGYETYAIGKIFGAASFGSESSKSYDNIDLCSRPKRGTCSFTDSYSKERACCYEAEPASQSKYTTVPLNGDECEYSTGNVEGRVHMDVSPYKTCQTFPNEVVAETDELKYLVYRGGETYDHSGYGMASLALDKMSQLAEEEKPFFVGLGIFKPHLPLVAPEEFFDYYDREKIHKKCFADDSYWTDTFADRLRNGLAPIWKETDQYGQVFGLADATQSTGVKETSISKEELIPTVRKAYYATTKYVDAVIKYFYDGINRLPKKVKQNTHIVITSDHGFLLGEFGRIGKWVLTESATRVPLTIIPSKKFLKKYKKTKIGTKVQAPVDHIDVLPTLLEMAGLPDEYRPLKSKKDDVLPGMSLSPYFSDCNSFTRAVSISEYETFYGSGRTISMRSKFFKYITYTEKRDAAFLFDYRGGAQYRMVERENVIDDPAYAHVKQWFENLFQTAIEAKDDKAWLTLKNIKPIDHDFSDKRGQNY